MPLEKTAAAFSIFPPAVSTVSHGQGRRPSFVRPLDWPLKSRNVQKVVPRAVAVQVETLFPLFIIFPLLYISPSFLLLCAWFLFVQIERKCFWYTFRSPRGIRELNKRERGAPRSLSCSLSIQAASYHETGWHPGESDQETKGREDEANERGIERKRDREISTSLSSKDARDGLGEFSVFYRTFFAEQFSFLVIVPADCYSNVLRIVIHSIVYFIY